MANSKAKAKRAQIWQARSARWKANAAHPWKVGDLCSAVYGSVGEGMIYRVTKVTTIPGVKNFYTGLIDHDRISLRVVPVFGILVDMEGRKPRTVNAEYCTPYEGEKLAVNMTPGEWVKHAHYEGTKGVLIANGDDFVTVLWSIPPGKQDDITKKIAADIAAEIDAEIMRDLLAK